MSNFNEYFRNKGLDVIIDKYLDKADEYSTKYQITNMKYEIVKEPAHPASYYIENELTASYKVKITYDLNNDGDTRETGFEIPKEIDGTFIIDGDYRVATNKLGNDFDCRMKLDGPGEHIINIDYNRRYDVDKKVLKIRKKNEEGRYTGSFTEIPFDNIDEYSDKELLRLTPKQTKKFEIKLDLDYTPEYITRQLLEDSIAFGDDRMKDLIVDKSIESVAQGFMNYLIRDNNGRLLWSTKKRIKTHFSKYDRLQEPLNAITSIAYRFFKRSAKTEDETSKEIQIPPGINAINLESLKSKITIPQTVAYNSSFADLIDIAATPINQNVNLQNELTVSTHVTDEGVLFDVYDKDFNKITIDYLDYLNKKVVASEYVDYDTNKVVPDENNMIEVKHRMKRKKVAADDYDFIDLHPDYRLSMTTRRTPFVNMTDSVRVMMSTSMLKQSIPLVNAQRPLVDTGNYDDLSNNVLNSKFEYPEGKVTKIDESNIEITLPDGEITIVPRRTAIQSINDVSIWTEPKVKVGDIVKKGDIITGAREITKDTVKSGLNTFVLYSAYKGLVHEDAVVISESYSDRMASYGVIDLSIDIKTSTSLKWIAPIGTRVKSKDSVVTLYKAVKIDKILTTLQEKLGSLGGEDLSEYTTEQHLTVPNNIDEAYVSDVMIQENIKPRIPGTIKAPDYTWAKESQKEIDKYMKNMDRNIIYEKFPEYVASDRLKLLELDPKEYKVVYKVRIRLIKVHKPGDGDKLTNRYGGKGVISAVLPDSEMPIVNGKHVELIMNPYSTINRKIPSVISEVALGNCAVKAHDLVDEYKKTATGRKKIMPLLKKLYPGRYDNMDVSDFIKLHETSKMEDVYYFNVGCFSKYTPEKIQELMDYLGVVMDSDVYLPKSDMTDLEELKKELPEDEYNKIVKDISGKTEKVEKPLMAGYVTIEQLYHIPSYSNKVTSDLITNIKRQEPIAGRGRYRDEGQKIGEMELSALLSRNVKKFIHSYREGSEKETNQKFLNNLMALGLMVVDDKGYAQGGSALKTSIENMKKKYGLAGEKGGIR